MTHRTPGAGAFKLTGALAGLAIAALVATALPGAALTSGGWNDNEWGSATVGVLNCAGYSTFKGRAAGKFLQPNTLSALSATVVDVKGVIVTNDGTRMLVDPGWLPAQGTAPANFYTNSLDAPALGAIETNLTGILHLPLATSTGAYNQYAQALSNGKSAGAAGAVNSSGAIALTGANPPANLPGAASLDLTTLLTAALGGLGAGAANLATAKVGIGAVASSVTLDACGAAVSKNLAAHLIRSYNIASLDTVIRAPTVNTTTSSIDATLRNLQTVINGLTAPGGSLLASVTTLVNSLKPITDLAPSGAQVTLGVTIDTTALRAILTTTRTDSTGLVSVNLTDGAVRVNLAQLVGGVNGRNPNTPLLLDQVAINKVTAAVSSITTELTAAVDAAKAAAIAAAKVTLTVRVAVVALGTACIGLVDTPVGALVAGTSLLIALPTCTTGLAGPTASVLVTGVNDLGLGASVGTLVQAELTSQLNNGVSTPLIDGVITPLATYIAPVIATMLGNTSSGNVGLLSLVVNEQNAPIGASGAQPAALSWTTIPVGRFDVAALGLQVLSAVGGSMNINVDFARSSVGASCAFGADLAPCAGY